MKTKFLIPVLAILFATGMSFTTVSLGKAQAQDFIRVNNQWVPIMEINCGQPGDNNCQVRLSDGSTHNVYDTNSLSSLKLTASEEPFEY